VLLGVHVRFESEMPHQVTDRADQLLLRGVALNALVLALSSTLINSMKMDFPMMPSLLCKDHGGPTMRCGVDVMKRACNPVADGRRLSRGLAIKQRTDVFHSAGRIVKGVKEWKGR
jgi:hypothetical protein